MAQRARAVGSASGGGRERSCMILLDGQQYCIDPAGSVAAALGKKWTLPLLGILGNRPTSRFSEIVEALDGVGAKALSARLRELQRLGLVTRAVANEGPVRVIYGLTARGEELRRALVPLLRWAGAVPAAD